MGHAAVRLEGGEILLTGGLEAFGSALAEAQVYAPDDAVLSSVGDMLEPRADHTATLISDGRVLIAGGYDGVFTHDTLELFDPVSGTFSAVTAILLIPREGHIATSLPDGRVLLEGGWNDEGDVETAEIYDPVSESVSVASGLEGLVFPSVSTDKPDYVPGEYVTVTGTGFSPGEVVALLFDETPLQQAPRMLAAVAAADGTIQNAEFEVQDRHVGTGFTLHASGMSSSWSAQTRFTDGSVLKITNMAISSPPGATDSDVSSNQTFVLSITVLNDAVPGPQKPDFEDISFSWTMPSGWSTPSCSSVPFNLASAASTTKSCTVQVPNSTGTNATIGVSATGSPSYGSCGAGAIVCTDSDSFIGIDVVEPAVLSVFSYSAPGTLKKSGALGTISLTVKNTGTGATAKSVTPSLGVTATGTAAVSGCGTGGSSTDLAAGASTTFTWSGCTVSGDGTLVFAASGSGTDENSGSTVTASQQMPTVTIDSTAPVLTVPSNMTVVTTGTSAVVTFSASATDDRDGSLTPTCTHASGSTFSLCNTSVSCSATDSAGNVGTASFTVSVVKNWYADSDDDTYGNSSANQQSCTQPFGYVSDSTDCNDGAPGVHPGATETCNEVDDDCDSQTDEGVTTTFYQDSDSDTYGNASNTTHACSAPSGYASNSTDCNDSASGVYPGATETCNAVDDDCDSQTDEGVTTTFYQDSDSYGSASNTLDACSAPSGYVSDDTDCNDGASGVHPGATEICNAVDDDCDSQTDELGVCHPEDVAPPVPVGVATTVDQAMAFLYESEPPFQVDVNSARLVAERSAVVRGAVFVRLDVDSSGVTTTAPLQGVHVSVAGHEEYGYTLTRDDGGYDLVLNGGESLTLAFEKEGYLPVQRKVMPRWQSYLNLDDIVLIERDLPVELDPDYSGTLM